MYIVILKRLKSLKLCKISIFRQSGHAKKFLLLHARNSWKEVVNTLLLQLL
jgi:hypothetical protein